MFCHGGKHIKAVILCFLSTCDVLTLLMSTVALELVFNTSEYMLNDRRSNLYSNIVENNNVHERLDDYKIQVVELDSKGYFLSIQEF